MYIKFKMYFRGKENNIDGKYICINIFYILHKYGKKIETYFS